MVAGPKEEGLWVACAAKVPGKCSKSGTCGSSWTADSGEFQGRAICSGCAKSLKVHRTNAMAPSDTVAQRQALGESGELRVASEGHHKLAFAKAVKVTKVTRTQVREAAAKVPAKQAKRAGRKRPAAKTA
jgi:hypothetical protein